MLHLTMALLLAAGAAGTPATAAVSPLQDCVAHGAFHSGGAQIRLAFEPARFSLPPERICAWTVAAASAVSAYFGRFPVPEARVELEPMERDGVSGGTTWGRTGLGPLIRIRLGRSTAQDALDRDWVMTHEMVHLSVPGVPDNSHWLEEGIATYVEPVARAQLGQLEPRRVWGDMYRDMRKGLPAAGDEGLDHTATWGRTYWGGALFCLLADVEIRKRTGNRLGLRDALRGVLAAGGDIRQDWSPQRVFEAADRAVGVPVLGPLYRRLRDAPEPQAAELEQLWKDLGVAADGDGVRLLDDAPLVAVRQAITENQSANKRE
jgi:hypothetical protein